MTEPKIKPIVWLHGEIKTPPFFKAARIESGMMLWRLQCGESLSMPQSRPMPSIGPRCHELRIVDESASWRIVYRIDSDAIVIGDIFAKKTGSTPQQAIDASKRRFRAYDEATK